MRDIVFLQLEIHTLVNTFMMRNEKGGKVSRDVERAVGQRNGCRKGLVGSR